MAKWTFEPGHTAAEFRARHMMVTYVRGAFKNVHGALEFDPEKPRLSSVEVTIDPTTIWTGEPQRDAHLRSRDFLDVDEFPQITFKGGQVKVIGDHDYVVVGDLTIRGVTRSVSLRVSYLWSVADTLVGREGRTMDRQGTEVASGLCSDDGDQSSRLRRELERHHGQRGIGCW